MNETLAQAIALAPKVASVAADIAARNIGREALIRAGILSLVSGRPAFALGVPGINKTGTLKDLSQRISGSVYYGALMPMIPSFDALFVEKTSIKETSEADGGKSIETRDTLGRAANAHIFFADEIWKGEPRVLQTVLDFANGDPIRHEGQDFNPPLLAFVAASNELPEPESNLAAMWSRMTIRIAVNSLDRAGKKSLVRARLNRGANTSAPAELTLAEVEQLRAARLAVEVPDEMIEVTLDIYQELLDADQEGFAWLWSDDRRFGRVFDVMQANALLDGRTKVGKPDLKCLELLLWDTPEQIATVKEKVAPYTRTPLSEAQELIDTLLAPSGTIADVKAGDRNKVVQAITQFEEAEAELAKLADEAKGDEQNSILALRNQVSEEKKNVVAAVLGAKRA